MQDETTEGWSVDYNHQHVLKESCGDDYIRVEQPESGGGSYEVIGRIGGEMYHYTHAHEDDAMERVGVLEQLSNVSVSFDVGDEVFVIDDSFESVVQRGYVGFGPDEHDGLPVFIPTDPYETDANEGRVIQVQEEQTIHAGADVVETLAFIGCEHLLELSDFDTCSVS